MHTMLSQPAILCNENIPFLKLGQHIVELSFPFTFLEFSPLSYAHHADRQPAILCIEKEHIN